MGYNLPNPPWTEKEDDLLRRYFTSMPLELLRAKLRYRRSLTAIRERAHKLQINPRTFVQWTPEKLAIALNEDLSCQSAAKLLGPTVTRNMIVNQRRKAKGIKHP